MRQAKLTATATADLRNILKYIARRSGNRVVGRNYVAKLRSACHKYAAIKGVIGRERLELRPDIRSVPFENYVIFFRYVDDEFEIVNIIEGHRDMEGLFEDT